MNRLLTVLILILLPAMGLARTSELKINKPVDIIGAGGAGITSFNKFGMIFMNPAAFGLPQNGHFSLLRQGFSANYDLYNFYNIYSYLGTNNYDLSTLTPELWKNLMQMSASIGMTGPLALGYLWDKIGILFYDEMITSAIVKQGAGIPYVDFGAYFDIGLLVGFGFEIPLPIDLGKYTKFYGGANVKIINRAKYENPQLSLIEAFDQGVSLISFKKGFLMAQGIGSDVGLIMKSENWAVGLVIRDWFTTQFAWKEYSAMFEPINTNIAISPTYFYPSFDFGGSYKINKILEKYLISDLTFSADLVNMFDFTENYLLKVRIGMELTAFGFLHLRGGIYKGYPTFGFGLIFPVISLNFAHFTEEYGEMPGSQPQQMYQVELQLIL